MVVLLSVFVLGGAGASQLPGCEGEGGPVSFVSFGVALFCGEWRRVSFRGLWRGKRGQSALEFGGGVVAVCFCFGGAGASQLPGCEGEGGPVSFGVVFVVCFCFETSRRASQLPGL